MTKEQFLKMGALSRKDLKVLQILHAVFREPGISRSRLCDRLDLNKNNMTDSVKFMLDEGYLRENGQNRSISGSGRRSIGLTLRPGLFYTLGATLTLEDHAIVLQDAARNVVEKVYLRNEGSPLPERFLEEIKQECAYLINKAVPEKFAASGWRFRGSSVAKAAK
ncbi:MAG: winged helix-turn-helix transcriptional regulator [Victivallales bacterium]